VQGFALSEKWPQPRNPARASGRENAGQAADLASGGFVPHIVLMLLQEIYTSSFVVRINSGVFSKELSKGRSKPWMIRP